jgi:hypothetical protein
MVSGKPDKFSAGDYALKHLSFLQNRREQRFVYFELPGADEIQPNPEVNRSFMS